ncbi:MAG: hypothetical protein QOH48_380 [Actinomycetota bacterium]|nr:hypothetical protein [Actinomycetota bacterium]
MVLLTAWNVGCLRAPAARPRPPVAAGDCMVQVDVLSDARRGRSNVRPPARVAALSDPQNGIT